MLRPQVAKRVYATCWGSSYSGRQRIETGETELRLQPFKQCFQSTSHSTRPLEEAPVPGAGLGGVRAPSPPGQLLREAAASALGTGEEEAASPSSPSTLTCKDLASEARSLRPPGLMDTLRAQAGAGAAPSPACPALRPQLRAASRPPGTASKKASCPEAALVPRSRGSRVTG